MTTVLRDGVGKGQFWTLEGEDRELMNVVAQVLNGLELRESAPVDGEQKSQ